MDGNSVRNELGGVCCGIDGSLFRGGMGVAV